MAEMKGTIPMPAIRYHEKKNLKKGKREKSSNKNSNKMLPLNPEKKSLKQ